jgi:formate dehydrogenase beta subunit
LIKTKSGSTVTNNRKIFAGGDIALGPGSVIDAVGSGKQAAREIDEFLGGDGIISGDEESDIIFNPIIGKIAGFAQLGRIPNKLQSSDLRRKNFEPVELVYDMQDAVSEAGRCLQCNLRLSIRGNPHPPEIYLAYNENNLDKVPADEGVIQLLDKEKEVFLIKGTNDMKQTLSEFIEDGKEASYFIFEADQLFSQRESELMQQYLRKHGEMPDSGDDLDDLF